MASVSLACDAWYNGTHRELTATVSSDYGSGTYSWSITSKYTTSQGPFTRVGLYINGTLVHDTGYCRDFNNYPCHSNKTKTGSWSGPTSGKIAVKLCLGAGHDNLTDATDSKTLTKVGTPTIATPTITEISRTSAKASSSMTDAKGGSQTDFYIDASLTNFGSVVKTITGTSDTFSGLSANTTYYVRANGSNGTNRGYSSVTNFKTSGNAPSIGTITTTPSRTGCSFSVPVTYDTNDSYSSIRIDYGTTTSYGNYVSSNSISGLSANTTYYYKVTITGTQGRSSTKTGSFVTTGNAPTISSFSATPSRTGCSFSVTGSYDNASFSSREIEYGTTTSYGSSTTSDSISSLSANTKYYFKIRIKDNFNRWSDWSTGDFTTTGNIPTISNVTQNINRTVYGFTYTGNYDNNASYSSIRNEWGTTSSYGSHNSTNAISSLTPNTHYYHRFRITDNWNRNSNWYTDEFTTLGNAPSISAGSITNLKSKSATISVTDSYDTNASISTMEIKIYLNNVLKHTLTSISNSLNTGDILKPGKNYVAKVTVTDNWNRTSNEYTLNFKTKGGFKFNGKMSDTIKINGKEVIGMKYNGIEII